MQEDAKLIVAKQLVPFVLLCLVYSIMWAIPLPINQQEEAILVTFCAGQAVAGLVLAAIVVGLGGGCRINRWIAGPTIVVLHCAALFTYPIRADFPIGFTGILALSTPMAFCTTLLVLRGATRCLSWRIVHASLNVEVAARLGKHRLGIGRIMVSTFVVATLIANAVAGARLYWNVGLMQPISAEISLRFLAGQILACMVTAVYGVVVGTPFVWALLAPRITIRRILVLVASCVVSTLLFGLGASSMLHVTFGWAAPTVLETLLLASLPMQLGFGITISCWLIAARVHGFRLEVSARRTAC